jgi:peroxiredoxin
MRIRALAVACSAIALLLGGSPAAAQRSGGAEDGRRFPTLRGVTLDGQGVSTEAYLGKRLIVFFLDPSHAQSSAAARALARISGLRTRHNFEILGVARRIDPERVRSFAQAEGLDYPILLDPLGAATRSVELAVPVALLLVDAEGYLVGALGRMPDTAPEVIGTTEAQLRSMLRLPGSEPDAKPSGHPSAPPFRAPRLEGGEPFDLASLRGRPVVLIFFLHTCPYCQAALRTLERELPRIPEPKRPALVGVEISGRRSGIGPALAREKLAFFPVVLDPDWSVRNAYAVSGTPVLFLIDAKGRIVLRTRDGWDTQRDPDLLRMYLAKLVGDPIPMRLHATSYSGSESCGVCHEAEHATWRLTSHASAFDTLVRHGADRNGECVGCHVVGFGREGGYSLARDREAPHSHLEDVGCESCHGRGGPHLSPAFLKDGGYARVCASCHDAKHSLGFEYASFLPRVSHAALAALPPEERARRAAALPEPSASAAFVGSEACRGCHSAEHATWSASAHARAGRSLQQSDRPGQRDCLRCHTTGFGRPGGFPEGASLEIAHPDLARVGCESCHGPGGAHIGEKDLRHGTILALRDKCDSCVILEICGACHDEANDPGFEYEIQRKIEAQRHGTLGSANEPDARPNP